MNYLLYFFFNHFPYVEEETRVINGREEVCLILPTRTNQLNRGRQGNWVMKCRLLELAPNARMQTHNVSLSYLSEEDRKKSIALGYKTRTNHIGRVYEEDITPEKKIDRTNRATNIRLSGTIILSDIQKDLLYRNEDNHKRYIVKLVLRNVKDYRLIYTGTICVDDIPRNDILTDTTSGKKYINVIFQKLSKLDTYMNTHQLIMARNDGSEIEIGRFKEWRNDNGWRQDTAELPITEDNSNTDNQRQMPDEIAGIKF